MYLKSLTIRGFKSFARKTVLEFQPGITIIVGPNGSGKSNIADAVMWVLGEQSPLTLRGNRMEDIIFSGSASMKPVNMAEVVLALDNSNNDFQLDFAEINMSRNVVRGGDSEYRLNNRSCRLLDIQELLSDAGVGRSLNSVISQGQLDEVLTCTPEHRRTYIEEAGGLLKYRKRREKAERKLIRMDEELKNTNAVLREVRRQLRPLQQQAGRLEKYQKLSTALKESRLKLDVTRLRGMQGEWNDYEEQRSIREKRLADLETVLTEKTGAARELDDSENSWRENESRKRDSFYKLVSIHEQLRASFELWEQKKRVLDATDRRKIHESLAAVSVRKAGVEKRLKECEHRLDDVKGRRSELQEKERAVKARIEDTVRKIASVEARLDVYKHADADIDGMETNWGPQMKEELEKLLPEQAALQERMKELNGSAELLAGTSESLERELREIHDRKLRFLEEKREAEIKQTYTAATLELLSNLDTNSWGTLNTTLALMSNDPTSGGLGGMLIESVKIDPAYEKAITGYLGPWIFGLIAKDNDSIEAAIEYLKKNELGQSLFFKYTETHKAEDAPVDEESDVPDGETQADGENEGVEPNDENCPEGCRSAAALVRAPEWFESALKVLLKDVVVADDLHKAFALADRYPEMIFLTPDGDVISSGTMVKGGSFDVHENYVLASKRKRESWEESYAQCVSELEDISIGLFACEQEEKSVLSERDKVKHEHREAQAALLKNAELLSACTSRIEWIEGQLENRGDQFKIIIEEKEDTAELERDLEKLRVLSTELELERKTLDDASGKLLSEEGSVYGELVPLREELGSLADREKELEKVVSGSSPEGSWSNVSEDDLDKVMGIHRHMLELLELKRSKIKSELDEGSNEARESLSKLHRIRDEIIELQRKHESLKEEIHREELSKAELKLKVEQLVGSIVDKHKMPLDFALKQYSVEESEGELERRAVELDAEIERLGPVNPEAITEKDSLEERHDFLKEQLSDIEKSKKELGRIIKDIDGEIENKFKDTLEETCNHFKEIFSILFPNGKAELRLSDPDDILNTGVEILAQPEGKKLRRISLLSGGEMSLTALAFFFALFRVRPSPFYFLDEVEAALDDVNLYRFLELVKQFKDESQLILVTHQKRSMEIADILYGVTMQDDGISRVVSQKVTFDGAEERKEREEREVSQTA